MEETKNKYFKVIETVKSILVPLAVFFAFLVVNFTVQFIFSIAFSAYTAINNPNLELSELESKATDLIYKNISLMYLIISVAFLLIFILVQKKTKFSKVVNLEYKKPAFPVVVMSLLLGTFVGVVLNAGITIMTKWLPESWVEGNKESVESFQGGNELIMLIAVVICAPIVEELIFRGFIYNGLKKIFNIIPKEPTKKTGLVSMIISAIITSALFGVYHGNILQALYTGFLSLFMVWIFEMSGSLISSMIVHCMFNFAGTPTYYLTNGIGEVASVILCSVLSVIVIIVTYRICKIKTE